MKETRELVIRLKVFNKENIRNLWRILRFESASSEQAKNRYECKIQVKCADGTRYENGDDSLLEDGNVIDLKKIELIDMDYHDAVLNRSINIVLSEGDSRNSNNFVVKGEDKDWIAGITSKVDDVLKSVKPQSVWFHKSFPYLLAAGSFCVGLFCLKLLSKDENIYSHINLSENWFVFIFVCVSLGLLPMFLLLGWCWELWKSVEFDFGPEHKKYAKNRRIKIGIVITAFILPIALNLLSGPVVMLFK